MMRRNWLDLSRKLVDQYDLDYTLASIQKALGDEALAYFGSGVLATKQFPIPFTIQRDPVTLEIVVDNGIAYDPNGQITRIDPIALGARSLMLPAGDGINPRFDLLVMRYRQRGDVTVPKPSDPIVTVPLNLVDDFELELIPGIPAPAPVYPTKGPLDIILNGFKSGPNAMVATDFTVDEFVRDVAFRGLVFLPIFVQEFAVGASNGMNLTFQISKKPLLPSCLSVFINGVKLLQDEWSVLNNIITLVEAPVAGQSVYVAYLADDPTSQNPLACVQETPAGDINGINTDFQLTGRAPTQDGTYVYVDGLFIPNNEWQLIQTDTYSIVRFLAGSIPAPQQSVEVAYFVNPATVGVSGGPPPTPVIGLSPQWVKYTVTHNQLQAPGLTSSFNLLNLMNQVVHGTIIKNTQQGAGLGITSYKVSLGTDDGSEGFARDHDLFEAPASDAQTVTNVLSAPRIGPLITVKVYAESTGANLDQSTAGVFDVYLLLSQLP